MERTLTFGAKAEALRLARGYDKNDLARRIVGRNKKSISDTTVADIEKDRLRPSKHMVGEYVRVFRLNDTEAAELWQLVEAGSPQSALSLELRRLYEASGLSLKAIAGRVTTETGQRTISVQYLHNFITGRRTPSKRELEQLATIFGVSRYRLEALAGWPPPCAIDYLTAYPEHAPIVDDVFRRAIDHEFTWWNQLTLAPSTAPAVMSAHSRLFHLREATKKSVVSLASECKLDIKTVREFELGESVPKRDIALRLATALNANSLVMLATTGHALPGMVKYLEEYPDTYPDIEALFTNASTDSFHNWHTVVGAIVADDLRPT